MKNYLFEDIQSIIQDKKLFFLFENSTVLVTGATGLIGSLLTKSFLAFANQNNVSIKVIAMVRSRKKTKKVFGEYLHNTNLQILEHDINWPKKIEEKIDYIIHGASLTSSHDFVSKPVETINTAVIGTNHLLQLALEKQVKGFLYISSLEVYGMPTQKEGIAELSEQNYGYLDPLEIRSSYSESKRCVETLCASYAAEYKLPVKIVRLTQTFGPGVAIDDTRVFAEFARCALYGNDIILHTTGETVRNYCYSVDAVKAILITLVKGISGEAYNVANPKTIISIYDMANLVASLAFSKINVIVENDTPASKGYNPIMKIALNTKKLTELGWKPTYSLQQMFERLIGYFKQLNEEY